MPTGVSGSEDAAPSGWIHFYPRRSQSVWRVEQETDKKQSRKVRDILSQVVQVVVSVDQSIKLGQETGCVEGWWSERCP